MAAIHNGYDPIVGGEESNTTGAALVVPAEAQGLVIAAAWAADWRLAGMQTEQMTYKVVSPPIPMIAARNINHALAATEHTAVPYSLRSEPTVRMERAAKSTARAIVTSGVFPALLARVAVFVANETADITLEAVSKLDTIDPAKGNDNAMEKFKVKTFSINKTENSGDEFKKVTYTLAAMQPFVDVFNVETECHVDVQVGDIIVYAASDTSPDAETIGVTVLESFDVDTLFQDSHVASLTNPDNGVTYKVGSLLRVDFCNEAGKLKVKFDGVAGAAHITRLVPSKQTVQNTSYPTITEDLAYFELHTQYNDRLEPIYPDWMEAFLDAKEGSGALGLQDTFIKEPKAYDEDGNPTLFNVIEQWSCAAADLTSGNIPYGTIKPYADVATFEANRLILMAQL